MNKFGSMSLHLFETINEQVFLFYSLVFYDILVTLQAPRRVICLLFFGDAAWLITVCVILDLTT
jgi:hypothetical protein